MKRPQIWWYAILGIGLILRIYHYLRNPAVWQDEAALILNVLDLPFEKMFGPLLHAEAAPPMFLVIERAVVLTLGSDGVYALRLFPFLASCLAFYLFADLMRRVLPGWPGVLALTLTAFSDRWLWHTCEAKPYAVDVLVAVAAMWWQVRTEGWSLIWRCLPAVVMVPLALWVSFPACFVIGGLLVGLLPSVYTANWSGRLAYGLLALSVGVAFLALALGPAAAQRNPDMESCWIAHFPPWNEPVKVPFWMLRSWFEVARYDFLPLGQVLVPFALLGGWTMFRRQEVSRLTVAILPLGLAFIASLIHRYPFGSSRLEFFATPGLAWLSAVGLQTCFPGIMNRSRVLAILVVLVLLLPVPQTLFRLVVPWPRAASDEVATYLLDHRQPGDQILVNHWEYEYYLRSIDGWRFWIGSYEPGDLPTAPGTTLWIVHTSDPTVEAFPFPTPAGWEVTSMQSWRGTRLFQLRRIGEPVNQGLPR